VRYVSHKPDQAPLRLRIHDLAAARMRYGYFRIYILLRREGWFVNHKRVYRLYQEDEGTQGTGRARSRPCGFDEHAAGLASALLGDPSMVRGRAAERNRKVS